jgi:hypothetical protein
MPKMGIMKMQTFAASHCVLAAKLGIGFREISCLEIVLKYGSCK